MTPRQPTTTSKRKRRERLARYARLKAGEVEIPHGRLSSYNQWGCRCGRCTAAYMEWYTAYSTRRSPKRKRLPPGLKQLQQTVSPEVARLIEEQYADDQAHRIGFAARYIDNPVEDAA